MGGWTVTTGLSDEVSQALSDVWTRDVRRNPFTAPAFLCRMSLASAARGREPVFAVYRAAKGESQAVWPLALGARGHLEFLPLEYSDQFTVLAVPGLGVSELGRGLGAVIREMRVDKITLSNIPTWSDTLEAVRVALSEAGWHVRAFPAKTCPLVQSDSPNGLTREFERHRRLRRDAQRLSREPGFQVEVFTDDEGLDEWCHGFCDAHQWRWNHNANSSMYVLPEARRLFQDVLSAWLDDDILVRFSIRVAKGRAAYAVGLKSGDRFIYHHATRSSVASTLGAGKVLIYHAGRWAADHGFSVLDLGMGTYEFKDRYANTDERLWRVLASKSRFSAVYLRGTVEQRIRESPGLQNFWTNWFNQKLRFPIRNWLASRRK